MVAWGAAKGRPQPSGAMAWLSILAFGFVDATCFQVGARHLRRSVLICPGRLLPPMFASRVVWEVCSARQGSLAAPPVQPRQDTSVRAHLCMYGHTHDHKTELLASCRLASAPLALPYLLWTSLFRCEYLSFPAGIPGGGPHADVRGPRKRHHRLTAADGGAAGVAALRRAAVRTWLCRVNWIRHLHHLDVELSIVRARLRRGFGASTWVVNLH